MIPEVASAIRIEAEHRNPPFEQRSHIRLSATSPDGSGPEIRSQNFADLLYELHARIAADKRETPRIKRAFVRFQGNDMAVEFMA